MKKNQDLAPWIQSISNHLWWSASTCEGNAQLLEENWLSMLKHITNKHTWRRTRGQLFHRCSHPPSFPCSSKGPSMAETWQLSICRSGGYCHPSKHLSRFGQTHRFLSHWELEVYHSMMFKYVPKREHFSYNGMIARTQLAAIDDNENAGGGQDVILKGNNAGEARYRRCFPKAHKRWVVKPIMQPKTYIFLPELQRGALKKCEDGNAVALVRGVNLPQNIASEPAPNKQELICRHRSRFSR